MFRHRVPSAGYGVRRANTQQNTTTSKVVVYYPFHPLYGMELVVERKQSGAVSSVVVVVEGSARNLTIPMWMVTADAACLQISSEVTLDVRALRRLNELLRDKLEGDRSENSSIDNPTSERAPTAPRRTGDGEGIAAVGVSDRWESVETGSGEVSCSRHRKTNHTNGGSDVRGGGREGTR